MVDDADRAQDEIDVALAQARSAAQARQMLIPTGHCHNCDEPVRGGANCFATKSAPWISKNANAE